MKITIAGRRHRCRNCKKYIFKGIHRVTDSFWLGHSNIVHNYCLECSIPILQNKKTWKKNAKELVRKIRILQSKKKYQDFLKQSKRFSILEEILS